MRYKKASLLILLVCGFTFTRGQNNIREKVFVHLSNTQLIVGETLRFSCYSYSEKTGKLSKLSNLLYFEILNEEYKSVFRSQVTLEKGVGSGMFYLPSHLETGNYHIVAYTRWMQNFNDLYHKRIVIVNPYKTYHKTDENASPIIHFFVEGDQLLNNVSNNVVIRAYDNYDLGQVVKGRFIDEEGNTIAKVKTDQFGCFRFTFVPKEKETYQLLIETGSGFNFYKLGDACTNCTRLNIVDKKDNYIVDLKSNMIEENTHELLVTQNHQVLKTILVQPSSETIISKSSLPVGLIALELIVNGEKYSERLVWNGAFIDNKDIKGIVEYPTMKEVSETFNINKPSTLSISVVEVSNVSGGIPNIAYEHAIDTQLETPLTAMYSGNAPSIQFLDNLLVCSKLKQQDTIPHAVVLLPEHQYGVIQGVLERSDNKKKPIVNAEVGLGFMGENDNIYVTMTDSAGNFKLMYDYKFPHRVGIVKAMGLQDNSYKISIIEPYYAKYPKFINPPVRLDSSQIQQIVKRSIDNQIQNAYYQSDSVNEKSEEQNSILSGAQSYVLDDYTRFTSMRDTFIELINNVGVSKNETKYELKVRMDGIDLGDKFSAPTLLLIDGIFVDSKAILNISPYLVERIDVINRRYYFGSVFFDGLIAIHTFNKDLSKPLLANHLVEFETNSIEGTESVVVSKETSDRIPHYEHLLFWKPKVHHSGGDLELEFSTSNVSGLFEINIEGIANDGSPISKKKFFRVNRKVAN